MSLYKRPSQRVRCTQPLYTARLDEGTFICSIMNPKPTVVYTYNKEPIYKYVTYLKALEKNNNDLGIPYVDPNLPVVVQAQKPKKIPEPEIDFPDRVQATLKVLKNGAVRTKLNCAVADMYEKYYRRAKKPPFKVVLQAYKTHGFSKAFLEKLKKNNDKQLLLATKISSIIQKIFEKEPVKKPKKKKEKKDTEEDEEPEPEVEEDDIPAEDGELDVEPDDPEEVVEEEEYMSDLET